MKKRLLVFTILITVIFLWEGCVNDKKEDPALNDLSVIEAQYGPLRDYIFFNVGTYWIYEDKNFY